MNCQTQNDVVPKHVVYFHKNANLSGINNFAAAIVEMIDHVLGGSTFLKSYK